MGVSRRKCAGIIGVSEAAIRKAITAGRIPVESDGTLDPDKVQAAWSKTTDPARTKPRTGSQGAHTPPQPEVQAQATVEAHLATTRVREILLAEGIDVGDGPLSFNDARTAETIVKVWQRDQLHAQAKGKLIDAETAGRRWADEIVKLRARMLAIPGDCALELSHLTKHEVSVIDRIVRDAMDQAAGDGPS